MELKTFKTYIKTNLANSFIWSFKSLTRALILYFKKSNNKIYLYVNY